MTQLTKNFNLIEFVSKDGAETPEAAILNINKLANNLQVLRDKIGEPLRIISGYRSPEHNKKVGGKRASKHLKGIAADITSKSRTPKQLAALIESLIKSGDMAQGGIGIYPGFVHYDIRGQKARW